MNTENASYLREPREPRRRRGLPAFLAVLCSLALALCLAGCSSGSASKTAASAGNADGDSQKITFALDWTPNTNHTGLYVAQALGYYAEEGLDVDIVQPPDGDADALVATDKAQLGIGFQDIMAAYLGSSDPLPVTAVAAVIQHNTSGIMSRAEDQVTSPAAMQGKSYGSWDMDVEKAIVQSVVETDGGDFNQVNIVPANSTDEVSGLRTGQFDTVWVYEAWALQNARNQNYPVNYFAFRDIDPTFDYYTPVIIANNDFLQNHPEAVKAFLRATAKGYEYAIEHPKDAAAILLQAAPEIDEDLALASQEYLADQYVADAPQWGYIDPARWNAFYAWMSENGLVEQPIVENTGFTNSYLPKEE